MSEHMDTIEFSFKVLPEDIPVSGYDFNPEITDDLCAALAKRCLVDEVKDVVLKYRVSPFDKKGLYVTGHMRGDVRQTCGISLEPMWTLIDIPFEIEFQPADVVAAIDVAEDDFETDVPEIMDIDGADVGDVAAQIFALEIPLYPRKPDIELGTLLVDREAKADIPSPFAVLESLKKKER